jgi:hypothetical protein
MQPWPPDLKIYEDLAERLLHKKWDLIGVRVSVPPRLHVSTTISPPFASLPLTPSAWRNCFNLGTSGAD